MSELANYSIETDHTVLLAFADGRRLRVPIGQLPHHLAKPDLEKVRASLRLRRDFIRNHMPKAALVLVGVGLIAIMSVGGKAVADMFNVPNPNPVPPKSEIVRSQYQHEGDIETAPKPSVEANSAAIADAPKAKKEDKADKPSTKKATTQLKPSKLPKPAIVPSVTPIPTPTPSPSPSPSPDPDPPAKDSNGSVAGDCTSIPVDPTLNCD